jgi:hypothetical protein
MPEPETTTGAELAGDQTANREGTDVTETGPFGTEEMSTEQPLGGVSEGILSRLGVPEEVAKQAGLGQKTETAPEPEAETQPETEPEAEAETEPEAEPEGEAEPEPEHDDKPHKAWAPEVQAEFNKRVGKLTKQRETEKARAEAAEAERDTFKEQLAAAQPVQIQPTEDNPLAGIETPEQLARVEKEIDYALDWAERNAEGCIGKNADGSEYEITPEKVAEVKRNANRALRQLPKREKWITQRAAADEIARAIAPSVFDKGSGVYQAIQGLLKEFPSIADHPARNLVLTDYLRGYALRVQEAERAASGNGTATAPKKTADSPNPLTRKIPPVAQHVARTSNAPARTGTKQVDDAMNNVVASGGDRSTIGAAFRAIKEAEKQSGPKRRTPAPV